MPRARRQPLRQLEPLSAVLARDRTAKSVSNREPITKTEWESAVGSRIAGRTRPARIERGILQVMVASSAWAQELSLLSATILETLRRAWPDLSGLRFRVGDARWSRPPEGRRIIVPPPAHLPDALERAIDRVADEPLREAIARAASTNLAWSRTRRER